MRSRSVSVQSVHCSLSLFVFIWSVGVSAFVGVVSVVVVVLRGFGVGVVAGGSGEFCSSYSFCSRRRAKRFRLARRSCAMPASLFV